jgi:hypothetical protein
MKPNFYNKGQQHGTYFKTRRSKFGFKDDIVSGKMDTVVTFNPTRICSFSYFICKESIS